MRSVALVFVFLVFPGVVAAATLEEDVQRLVEVFRGDKSQHVQAVRSLAWMGISDSRVYDIVEQHLKADADTVGYDRNGRDRVAHYLRALGFSGNGKYLPTLNAFKDHADFGRHASNALKDFPQYQKWDPVISNRATFFDAKYSDDVNRVMNMLAADDIQLKGLGARRMRHGPHHDQPLLDRLEKETRALYPRAKDFDAETNDAIGWMLIALGSSRDPKYLPLLEEAMTTTSDRKIRNGATSGLKFYGNKGYEIINRQYGRERTDLPQPPR